MVTLTITVEEKPNGAMEVHYKEPAQVATELEGLVVTEARQGANRAVENLMTELKRKRKSSDRRQQNEGAN